MAKTKVERSNAAHQRAIKTLEAKKEYHMNVIESQNKRKAVMSKSERDRAYDTHMAFAGVARRAKKAK